MITLLPKKLFWQLKNNEAVWMWGLTIAVTLLVFLALLYSRGRFEQAFSYFSIPHAYSKDMVLFYGDGCRYCDHVEEFIVKNYVEDRVSFVRLEVLNHPTNVNILYDKAQRCGIPANQIGVPFLWDGATKTCVLGYLDIISFFKQKLKEQ